MPIVFLLDVSLSMGVAIEPSKTKNIGPKAGSSNSLLNYAKNGIFAFVRKMKEMNMQDSIVLITYSNKVEVRVEKTKDVTQVISYLRRNLLLEDVSNTHNAINFVTSYIKSNFTEDEVVHLFLITDDDMNYCAKAKELLLPLPLKASLNFIFINKTNGNNIVDKMIHLNNGNGKIFYTDSKIASAVSQFEKIYEDIYEVFPISIVLGKFTSPSSHLIPSPKKNRDICKKEKGVFIATIVGFIDCEDIPFPTIESQHFISCMPHLKNHKPKPNILLLLQNCLFSQNMVAIIQLGESYFGMLSTLVYKKKPTLILSTFSPNQDLFWVGAYRNLGPSSELEVNPYATNDDRSENTPFPYVEELDSSYLLEDTHPLFKQPNIEENISKILTNLKTVGLRESFFAKEIDKIKITCSVYCMPEIIASIADFLESALSEFKSSDLEGIKAIITELKELCINDAIIE